MNRSVLIGLLGLAVGIIGTRALHAGAVVDPSRQEEERLEFQTQQPWSPRVDLNADVAMVYGIGKTLPARIKDWKDHGYRIHVMTGVAWGNYQDYFYGRWDGTPHKDQAQTRHDGSIRGHGGDVYYMSPGIDYGKYLSEGVLKALDAGATAVCLEEPEFWVDTGWEENFKRQWKEYYHEDWQAPDSSPEAQYKASKLKYYLYRRALAQVFDAVHDYAKKHGREIPCYVATHSLINYAQWRIVSPESSLMDVGCDGYVAQVWTGTSRTPNVYDGVRRERTFDTAFLEYGVMQNLVRASGRRMWFLNDPVEDNPRHNWVDYRTNWECTLTASLLQPEIWRYEIMPWPQRIFMRRYPSATQPSRREPIPKEYETELQAVITAMGDMKQPESAIRWQEAGTQGVGVLVSDTLMFQRGQPMTSDEHLGHVYGLALPLLKHGVPVEPVQIENATAPKFLDRYKVLLLSYVGQKPPSPAFHTALANWVKQGGALVVVDDDSDPFNSVPEWWNAKPLAYKMPREHLFEQLGLPMDFVGSKSVGKGAVIRESASPAKLTYEKDGSTRVRALASEAAKMVGVPWKETEAIVLHRGPYVVAAGLEEGVSDAKTYSLDGHFIPLFDAALPVKTHVEISPGVKSLLVDLDSESLAKEGVIAAACRVTDQQITPDAIKFKVDGLEGSNGVVCVRMSAGPKMVQVRDKKLTTGDFEYSDGLLRIRFVNSAAGAPVEIQK